MNSRGKTKEDLLSQHMLLFQKVKLKAAQNASSVLQCSF